MVIRNDELSNTTTYDSITSYGGLVLKNTNPADATISIDSSIPLHPVKPVSGAIANRLVCLLRYFACFRRIFFGK